MDIILIGGMWLDGRAWDDVIPHLREAGHRPVALTLPGQGGDGEPTLDAQLDAVVTAIDAAEKPLVVGHSAACALAWLAADRRPDAVGRVALIGGFPSAEGSAYFDMFPPVDGEVRFPGWEPFEGPDAADLDAPTRDRIEAMSVPVADGVTGGTVHYTDARRLHVPVTVVCPEFSVEEAQGWMAEVDVPEFTEAHHIDFVDIDSGHWPMFSAPQRLAQVLSEIADRPLPQLVPAWEPPLAGTADQHLAASLDRLRATFRWKADGLDIDQLRQQLPSSALSLGGLLKHLAVCEDDIFAWRIAGDRPESWAMAPDGVDPAAWQFEVTESETAAGLYEKYDSAVRRSRARLQAHLDGDGLDRPGSIEFGELRPSIRRHVHDLVEEYGRHTGHADLLREAVDGRTGEDPDPTWTWDVLS